MDTWLSLELSTHPRFLRCQRSFICCFKTSLVFFLNQKNVKIIVKQCQLSEKNILQFFKNLSSAGKINADETAIQVRTKLSSLFEVKTIAQKPLVFLPLYMNNKGNGQRMEMYKSNL